MGGLDRMEQVCFNVTLYMHSVYSRMPTRGKLDYASYLNH